MKPLNCKCYILTRKKKSHKFPDNITFSDDIQLKEKTNKKNKQSSPENSRILSGTPRRAGRSLARV